jgi:hypothetical protein
MPHAIDLSVAAGSGSIRAALLALLLAGGPVAAAAQAATEPALPMTAQACEDRYLGDQVKVGRDVVYMPTPDDLVDAMLEMAGVTAADHVIDLGAGDGRIVIAAARDHGATGLGIEYDPDIVELAHCMVRVAGVGERVSIVQGDIFVEDFSTATVLTLFLLPEVNLCLRHRVLSLAPGTRVVSHHFRMGGWQNDDIRIINERVAFLWIVPARIGGRWLIRDAAGASLFALDLRQHFQEVTGVIEHAGVQRRLPYVVLRGTELTFQLTDADGNYQQFRGRIAGAGLSGEWQQGTGPRVAVTGRLENGLAAAPWAVRYAGCEHYYER